MRLAINPRRIQFIKRGVVMIIEGRTIATILIYIFTFIGYLLGKSIEKDQEREHLLEKIRIIKEFVKWKQENKDE